MAGNSKAIDTLVLPEAIKQLVELKQESAAVREEMVLLLEASVKLNATLGGSTPATFAKNAKASTDATEKLIQSSNRAIEVENKKAAAQEAAYNKYLVLLSKQQAERDKADAKEIAVAEKKAARLQAIQDKADAEIARKQGRQLQPDRSGLISNIDKDDSPAVNYQPVIVGNENMAITAKASAESVGAENETLLQQQAILESLSATQRENLETLIALQTERALNAAELKNLNTETLAGQERAIALTAEQLRLKIAIQEVNLALNQETKQDLATQTSINELGVSVDRLRNAYNSLTAAERESAEGKAMLIELQLLDAEYKELVLTTGRTQVQVGAYEKALAKATDTSQLAATGIQVLTRSLVRLVVQFALFSVAFKAIQFLYDYIKALDIFNPIATEAQVRQEALSKAFESADYTKGVQAIQELGINLDLAKKGFADSDTVVNEYNETIGKTTGYVDNLTEAQKGFVANAAIYIDMIQKETAAQIILGESAKLVADNEKRRQELLDGVAESRKKLNDYEKSGVRNPAIEEAEYQLTQNIKRNQQEMIDNDKKLAQQLTGSNSAAEALLKQRNADQSSLGIKPGSSGTGGADAIAQLRTSLANSELERQKLISQQKINDDKLSYETRIQAARDFYSASKQILDNNEKLATDGIKLSADQKLKIESDYSNQLLQAQLNRDSQLNTLRDKQYKQDQEILKNNIQVQKDLFKAVLDDPNQSYSAKIAALSVYNDKSLQLIKTTYAEQVKEAGKNSESIKLAKQAQTKSELELTNEVADETIKIQNETSAKLKAQLERALSDDATLAKTAIEQQAQINDGVLAGIEDRKDAELRVLDAKYASGLLKEKTYQARLKAIQDQANIDRLGAIAFFEQTKLEILQAKENADVNQTRARGGSDADVAAVRANSGVGAQTQVVATAGRNFSKAANTSDTDLAKEAADKKRAAEQAALEFAQQTEKSIEDLVNKGYENQISKLEQIGKLIDENAQIEKDAVSRSLDTQSNKARREAEIDAQTASQQRALQQKINEEKSKEAKAQKGENIFSIIGNTAVAISKVLSQTGIFAIPLVPIVAALGAAQLAAAIAAPIPSFFRGTGSGTHKGGLARVGELGPELISEPGKTPYFSPGTATILNLPEGTRVAPHNMLPKTPEWTSNSTGSRDAVVSELRGVKRAIEGQKQSKPRLSGWVEAQRQADAWGRYSSQFYK